MSLKKHKSQCKAVEVTLNSKEEGLLSGFRPRIRPRERVSVSNAREGPERRKITLIKKQCKMLSSKLMTCKETLRQVFICLRPPPLQGFCLGWSSNFVGSESGQTYIEC